MAVAGHMLDIEGRLDNIAAGVDEGSEGQQHDLNLSQAQESVLRESRTGLEQVKDAIIEYIASQWDQTHLAKVPDTRSEEHTSELQSRGHRLCSPLLEQ